jgi:hypothetical protein
MSLPIAVPVSRGLGTGHRQHPERDLLGLKPGNDLQQVANRPRQPVQLGDGEGVALADVIQGGLKLLALSDRRHLLAENLVASGGSKFTLLSFETGNLGKGGCPGIADQHGDFCLTWDYEATIP